MSNILYILYAILIFGFIIIMHELGHFIVGRLCGIDVTEFSLGFGPKLFSRQGKHTRFSIRLLPLGGYCQFAGEIDEQDDSPNSLYRHSPWQRIAVSVAGPVMNFLTAYLAILVFLIAIGFQLSVPVIHDVIADTPAQIVGLQAGDIVTAVNGVEISMDEAGAAKLQEVIRESSPDAELTFAIERAGARETYALTAQDTPDGRMIGIHLGTVTQRYSLFPGLRDSMIILVSYVRSMLDMFRELFTSKDILSQTSGPVGIISVVSEGVRAGFDVVLNIIVLISLNLGLVNLFPFPALDGGHIVWYLIEALRRKPLNRKYESWVNAAGLMCLLGLILVITYQDITRLVTGG